jgi:hypothetical protein
MKRTEPRFVVCVKNKGYAASLELRKIYQAVPDQAAAKFHHIRVIDESGEDGEDYLYPESYFVAVQLPQSAEGAVRRAVGARGQQQRASRLCPANPAFPVRTRRLCG